MGKLKQLLIEEEDMQEFKPYVFQDTDPESITLGLWSIRWSTSMGFDGYGTEEEALQELKKLIEEESNE